MGYSYGRKSEKELSTCHPDLQVVYRTAINYMDITVMQGYRPEQEQLQKFLASKSQLKKGRHNIYPSDAIDGGPYKKKFRGVDWRTDASLIKAIKERDKIIRAEERNEITKSKFQISIMYINEEIVEIRENIKLWASYGALILGIGYAKGIPLIQGSDWDGDWDFTEHTLIDSPHVERANSKAEIIRG